MILVDSNVISEPWKPAPEPRVLQWTDAQAIERFIYPGLRLPNCVLGSRQCPDGRRRATPYDRLESDVLPLFEGANLPFDLEAWRAYADIMARAKAAG